MFDTPDEILRQCRAGEDSHTEFKEVRLGKRGVTSPNTDDLAGELVAFANADGGTVMLGVDDSGEIQGLPRDRVGEVETWLVNVASNNCVPPIRPRLRSEVLRDAAGEDRHVLLAGVPRGIHVHRTARGRYYLRIGSTKRDLDPPELARLFQDRGRGYVFDEQAVVAAEAGELDWNRLEAFFGRAPKIPWLDLLRNTQVVLRDEEGTDRPSVAGLLTFGKEPTEHLRSAWIEAACYRGTRLSSDELVHEDRLKGTAPDQIDAAVAFIMRFAAPDGERRAARPYDLDVVDEAIVNAVAHRDYSIYGSKIRLFLFADRLEIYSPGKLPNTLTLEAMPYRVFTRNQLLVNFLSHIHSKRTGRVFLESRGEGVRKILEAGEAHSGRRPEYELFGEELRLTIWAKTG